MLQERRTSKTECFPEGEGKIKCDGHYIEDAATESKTQWFATRCWGWNHGFKGDAQPVQRFQVMAENIRERSEAAVQEEAKTPAAKSEGEDMEPLAASKSEGEDIEQLAIKMEALSVGAAASSSASDGAQKDWGLC